MTGRLDIGPRATAVLEAHLSQLRFRVGRVFSVLMVLQWAACIVIACVISPRAWAGEESNIHPHVLGALFVGGAIAVPCVVLLMKLPQRSVTIHATCIGQVLFSSLLIHLMGGRIETHFHVFGSLAFIAMYHDWRLLIPATVVVASDHLVRGYLWPQSVFGVMQATMWRAIEHAGWVLFEDAVLVYGCVHSMRMSRQIATAVAENAEAKELVEQKVERRTRELVEAQAEISAERNLLASIVNNIPLGVYWKDTRSRYLGCNPNFASQFELSDPEMIEGRTDDELGCVPEEARAEQASDNAVMTSGAAIVNHETTRTVGGRARQIVLSKVPLRGRGDSVIGVVGLWLDVTEKRELEQQLSQSQRLESVGQLAAGIAHEINTPVQYVSDNLRFLREQFGAIRSVVDLYATSLTPDGPKKSWPERRAAVEARIAELDLPFVLSEVPLALDQSLDGLERVTAIVRAMKEFSHPGSTRKEPSDINKAIESTVTVCTNRWKYHADVECDLDPKLPQIPCLIAEFNQVVLNLVVNAADAIGEKRGTVGGKGLIRVSTREVGECIEVRIADDGAGIPESVKHKIFAPFFTTKGAGKGTGQGLAISRNIIVKKLGGSIDFESVVGEGTTFVIRLPMVSVDELDVQKEAA